MFSAFFLFFPGQGALPAGEVPAGSYSRLIRITDLMIIAWMDDRDSICATWDRVLRIVLIKNDAFLNCFLPIA